jgi:WD40 repeat protein
MRRVIKYTFFSLVVAVSICAPRAKYFCKHTGHVGEAVFAPDARHFASVSHSDHTVRIWNGVTREQLAVIRREDGDCPEVAFSPDSKWVAVGGNIDKTITVRRTVDGEEVLRLTGHTSEVDSVAFSPDGKALASGSRGGVIKVWDLATGKETFAVKTHEWCGSVAFSPDGKFLASGGLRGAIQIWDLSTGKESLSIPDGGIGMRLLFSPDGKILCSAHQTQLRLWDVGTGKERTCERPDWFSWGDYIEALTFSPNSRTLVAGHEVGIGLWNVETGKNTTAWFDDGVTPYLRFPDRYLINPENLFRERRSQNGPNLLAAAFKPNGDLMLLGERWNTVMLWRLTSVSLKK